MKIYLKNLLFIFTVFTLLLSCKKDTIENESSTNQTNNITEKVKAWYNAQAPAQIGKSAASLQKDEITLNPRMGELLWNKTFYSSIDNISFTPIVDLANASTESAKYLITEQQNNKIVNGYICFVLADKTKSTDLPVITTGTLNAEQISGFTGAIIKYDLNGSLISSKHFENGNIINSKADVMLDKLNMDKTKQGKDNTSNFEQVCYIIDHWWVTYVNGEIVSIEYEGSTEVCSGGSSGGGGNGGPSSTQVAEAAAQHILNSLDTASALVDIFDESATATTRTRLYKWKCVKNPTWSVLAHDKGVHRVRNGVWSWVSLENLNISVTGFVPGGTLNATKVFANATIGTYNAIMDITVNVSSHVTVANAPITLYEDFSSHKSWNVNDAPNPGY